MKKYYCIPVNDCAIKHDQLCLRDHLMYVSKKAYDLDCTFREFVFGEIFETISDDILEHLLEEQDNNIKELCKESKIPSTLILVEQDDNLQEMITGENFDTSDIEFIKRYQTTGEETLDTYERNNNYDEYVKNFFTKYKKRKEQVQNEAERKDIIDTYKSFVK